MIPAPQAVHPDLQCLTPNFQWSLSLRSSPVSSRASLLSELEISLPGASLRGSVFHRIQEEEEEDEEEEDQDEEEVSFKTDIEVDDRTFMVESDTSDHELRDQVGDLELLKYGIRLL